MADDLPVVDRDDRALDREQVGDIVDFGLVVAHTEADLGQFDDGGKVALGGRTQDDAIRKCHGSTIP